MLTRGTKSGALLLRKQQMLKFQVVGHKEWRNVELYMSGRIWALDVALKCQDSDANRLI